MKVAELRARDELAEIIDDRWHGYGYNPQGIADAILAAGYRKPRVITTTKEVDALPDMSIVMTTYGDAWTIYRNNPLIPAEHFHGLVEHGPATVLHEPEVTA